MNNYREVLSSLNSYERTNNLKQLVKHLNRLKLLKKLLSYGKRITKPSVEYLAIDRSIASHTRELIRKELKPFLSELKIFAKNGRFSIQGKADIKSSYDDPNYQIIRRDFNSKLSKRMQNILVPFTYIDNIYISGTSITFYIPLENVDLSDMVNEMKVFAKLVDLSTKNVKKTIQSKIIEFIEIEKMPYDMIPMHIEKELKKGRTLSKDTFEKSKIYLSKEIVNKILQLSITISAKNNKRLL